MGQNILAKYMCTIVRVKRYVTRPLNPSFTPHTAATNKGATVIAYKTGVQVALDIE